MPEDTYNAGELVELITNHKLVRLKTDMDDTGHYLASLDINNEWPPDRLGAIIYVHHTDIFCRVDAGAHS